MKKKVFSILLAFGLALTLSTSVYAEVDNSAAQAAEQVATEEQNVTEETISQQAAEQAEIAPPYYITVDCTNCITRVYCNYNKDTDSWETLVREMICSTGRSGHTTPKGTYSIYKHVDGGGAHLMVDGTYGRWCMRWNGSYMFHSVCYSSAKASQPIAQEVADLGKNVSRGCIRLSVTDAQWLYNTMPNGTVVYIY